MKTIRYLAIGICGVVILSIPLAYASAQSLSIQAISPGTSVFADSKITFIIVSSGFAPAAYQVSDSFAETTVSTSDISGAGNFSWVPLASDVGTHTLSISASDFSGNAASTTETIMVEPAPSISVASVSPNHSIMPGTKFSFSVSTIGFTNPSYIVSDAFGDSTVTDSDMDTSGNFSWTPADIGQDGIHTINVYAYDSLGHSASVNVPIQVGPGPSLIIQSLSPGASVSPSQTLSFTVNASNFSPTEFALSDTFAHTTLANSDITSTGSFYWNPQPSDIGTHVITITGSIGAYGQSASTTQTITVLGTPSTVSSAIATTSQEEGVVFTGTLYSGMKGAQVTELQTILSQQGFFSATPNGYFGPLTVAAVDKLQAAHGLQQIGVVGPSTRAVLNSLVTGSQTIVSAQASTTPSSGYTFENPVVFGQSGTDVLQLQKSLAALGFFSGQPTGYFGDATLEAVIQFQKTKGISLIDQLGSVTRAALNQ